MDHIAHGRRDPGHMSDPAALELYQTSYEQGRYLDAYKLACAHRERFKWDRQGFPKGWSADARRAVIVEGFN